MAYSRGEEVEAPVVTAVTLTGGTLVMSSFVVEITALNNIAVVSLLVEGVRISVHGRASFCL